MALYKEVGDLYNWSKVIEEDLVKVIAKRESKSLDSNNKSGQKASN